MHEVADGAGNVGYASTFCRTALPGQFAGNGNRKCECNCVQYTDAGNHAFEFCETG